MLVTASGNRIVSIPQGYKYLRRNLTGIEYLVNPQQWMSSPIAYRQSNNDIFLIEAILLK